jgi:hypothetical protein
LNALKARILISVSEPETGTRCGSGSKLDVQVPVCQKLEHLFPFSIHNYRYGTCTEQQFQS